MNFINYSMLVVNASRPIPRKGMFQRFRLSNSFERFSLDFFDVNERAEQQELLPVLIKVYPTGQHPHATALY